MKLRGIIVLLVVLVVLLYVILNTREHLTPGPPTLLTLQTDTQDLDSRLTELKTEFDKMSAQAKQGADAAAQSKAQMAVLKNS
jgi:hypothetical protein